MARILLIVLVLGLVLAVQIQATPVIYVNDSDLQEEPTNTTVVLDPCANGCGGGGGTSIPVEEFHPEYYPPITDPDDCDLLFAEWDNSRSDCRHAVTSGRFDLWQDVATVMLGFALFAFFMVLLSKVIENG